MCRVVCNRIPVDRFLFFARNGPNIEVRLDREILLKGIDSQFEVAKRYLEKKNAGAH
jgi:hypothetical protein